MNAATKPAVTAENSLELNAEQKLDREVTAAELQANNVVIRGDEDYQSAAIVTSSVKKMLKRVEEYWEPMRISTKKAYDDVLAHKKEMTEPLKRAEQTLKRKMSNYIVEQELKRRKKKEAMRRLAQEESDKKLQEAINATDSGDEAAAEYAITEAEVYDDAALNGSLVKQTPKANGVSTSKAWRITSVDSTKVPISVNGAVIRPVDEKSVMQLIKASKGKIKIPGIEYEETVNISVRA